jgi:hypothetical protein
MPDKTTRAAAARDKKEGESASTQAGEYVHEEIEHVREGKHGARSARQAIAIGLSKARRDGVKVPVSKKASASTKKKAHQDEAAAHDHHKPAVKRSTATRATLKKEGHAAASKTALSRQASKSSAAKRPASSRSAAASKAAHTKGAAGRSAAAKKAAATRAKKKS